jgi:predicted kinase
MSGPKPTLTVLIGAAGSGKSTYAKAHWHPFQVVSSDRLREAVANDAWDQSATSDAFFLLHRIVEMRLRRGLDTVVDATNSYAEHRASLLAIARHEDACAHAVVMATPLPVCLDRNARRSPSVPESVAVAQFERIAGDLRTLDREGFDDVEFAGSGSVMANDGDHHHEERSVAGMTLVQVAELIIAEEIPADAVFDAAEGDMPMIPGPDGEHEGEFIMEPVLSWRVDHDD